MSSGYREVVIETYWDSAHRRKIRARPLPDQGYSTTVNVECSLAMRESQPIGSLFVVEAIVKDSVDGTIVLYSHHTAPYQVVSSDQANSIIALNRTGKRSLVI